MIGQTGTGGPTAGIAPYCRPPCSCLHLVGLEGRLVTPLDTRSASPTVLLKFVLGGSGTFVSSHPVGNASNFLVTPEAPLRVRRPAERVFKWGRE